MSKGFSLIELILVISIISIISVFSITGAQSLLHSRTHNNGYIQLKNSLFSAQSNSQNTGFTTIACPSIDSQTCSSGPDWSRGWLIYNDFDDDKVLDDSETIVLVRKIENDHLSIKFNALGNGQKIVFYSNGRLWPNGNFVICHDRIASRFKITTTLSGRLQFGESELFECD